MPARNLTRPSAVSAYTGVAAAFPGLAGAPSAGSTATGEMRHGYIEADAVRVFYRGRRRGGRCCCTRSPIRRSTSAT
jgi:hypothetical protein